MKLSHKFTLAFTLISLIAIGLAAVFVLAATSFEFNRYLQDQRQGNFADAARSYYEQNGSWRGVDKALQQAGLLPPPVKSGGQGNPPPFVLLDSDRRVIVPGGTYRLGDILPVAKNEQSAQVVVNGRVVGTVLDTGQPLIKNAVEQQYSNRINIALLIAAAGGMLAALLLGMTLSRSLTRPVKELTEATRSLACGDLNQQVPIRSSDELGELAASFNQMSADLARANQARRQMTADIAHDLRNPLTVIGGYIEGMQDGVLKPTPERFAAIHGEIRQLQRLVEDLRTLSLADAGELALLRQPVSPVSLLEKAQETYRFEAERQNVALTLDVEENLPRVNVDPERIGQVLGNLVSNALHHTGGESPGDFIRLSARAAPGGVILGVQDNGSGIAPDVLPHIFERSFRGDPARQGSASGLGLSIARSIVELHGGKMTAFSLGSGYGAAFEVFLPAHPGS